MKDTATISYDPAHHHHHHQQQQQQHQHHSSHQQHQQPSSHHQLWNQQQRHQHQTHTTSIYGNQSVQATPGAAALSPQTPRSILGTAQSTQHVHHQQLGQYHQQIQPHNSTPYYQQAATHLYPSYQPHPAHPQDQQNQQQQQPTLQHTTTDHQQLSHHHHQTGPAPVSIAQTVVPSSIVTPQQQQHNSIHHSQNPASTQAATLNHGGWAQSIGGITHQGHHNVVGDHSSMAYMTHGYTNHTTASTDHQRNSNGSMLNQPMGTSPQGNSYSVEALYGNNAVAAAAAAAAAYNYSTNYNAAFFQASNNGHHTPAGHPTQANLSNFWNHNQPTQQQTNHSQTTVNQAQVQQRQPTITSEPASNYLHDPRLYYGRPAYAQNLQNFGHHTQVTPSQGSEILHHRMASTIPQQNQFIHQEQLRQSNQQQHPIQQQHHQQAPLQSLQKEQSHQIIQNSNLSQAHDHHGPQNHQNIHNDVQGNGVESQLLSMTEDLPPSRHFPPQVKKSQPQLSRQNINPDFTMESNTHGNKNAVNDQLHIMNTPLLNNNTVKAKLESNLNQTQNDVVKGEEFTKAPSGEIKEQASLSLSCMTSSNNAQKPSKDNVQVSHGSKPQSTNTVTAQPVQRSSFRNQPEEKSKLISPNLSKKPIAERERHTSIGTDSKSSITSSRLQDSDQTSSLEENMMGLTIKPPSRKTTWASIASQPAKIAQPKSLKSKMAGSNLVLSSAKHLVAVSLESSGLDSKNGINPAIKNSVSAAATSIQRTSLSPPVPKSPAPTAIKLDILGEDSAKSKISWPSVNASLKPSIDETPAKLDNASSNRTSNLDVTSNDKLKKDDEHLNRDYRDLPFKDQNHNQRSSEKMVNSYQPLNGGGRDFWNRRDQTRDYRVRRDSDRKEGYDFERGGAESHDDQDKRDVSNSRRDFKPFNSRVHNQLRNDESTRGRGPHREPIKRATAYEHHPEIFQNFRPSNNRQEFREHHNSRSPNSSKPITNQTTHHHYNNIRDGVMANTPNLDVNLHPHLNPENFNPKSFDLEQSNARYFIIKSYSEDDIHRSIKYSIWCSTNHGNKRLDEAFRQQQAKDGPIYLFFSVNGSGHFCGMAQMTSSVDFESSSGVWAQSKWLGEFSVKWLYVKDVPNSVLRHITLENNEDKPVTNSRDTQEVPSEKGKAVLKILHQYTHTSSIFDDFMHYERRQEEEKFKKSHMVQSNNQSEERVDRNNTGPGNIRFNRPYAGGRNHDFQGGRERTSRFAS